MVLLPQSTEGEWEGRAPCVMGDRRVAQTRLEKGRAPTGLSKQQGVAESCEPLNHTGSHLISVLRKI